MAKDTPAEEPVKPTRTRRTAPAATPPVVEAPAPTGPDRRLWWAVGFLGAVVLFAAGYLVGNATASPDVVMGAGAIVDHRPPGPGGGHPHRVYPEHRVPGRMPGAGTAPAPDDTRATEGAGFLGLAGIDTPGSVRVVRVVPGSPADQAGIVIGDRIISYDGTPITSMEQLADLVGGTPPGTSVIVVVGRPGGAREAEVVVGSRSD